LPQAKTRPPIVKTRSLSKPAPRKLISVKRTLITGTAALKKEKTQPSASGGCGGGESFRKDANQMTMERLIQPSCSHVSSSTASSANAKIRGSKSTKSISNRARMVMSNRPNTGSNTGVDHIAKNIQNTGLLVKNKLKQTDKSAVAKSTTDDKVKLTEICFIKDTDGKKVIATYHNEGNNDGNDNLIVSWNPGTSNPQVYTGPSHKPRRNSMLNASGTTKRLIRAHTFQKGSLSLSKVAKVKTAKRSKRSLFMHLSTTDTGKKFRGKKAKIIKKNKPPLIE